MTAVMGAVALLTAILKSFPIVDKWLSWGLLVYLKARYKDMEDADVQALHELIVNKDQRAIEKLLGYSKAGEPSGIPGAVIVPSLPGVPGSSNPQGS